MTIPMTMFPADFATGLAGRYRLGRELGAGGMATVVSRRPPSASCSPIVYVLPFTLYVYGG